MQDERGKIVVVFATFNGAQTLPRMLDAYLRLAPSEADWSIVAVDNGSTDATADILKNYAARLPLTILDHPVPGKNAALNMALRHIGLEADFYIFTDDDAVPSPTFMQEWDRVRRAFPEAELFGGAITPIFDGDVPDLVKRLSKYHHVLYASTSILQAGAIPPDAVYGPNMAVRRSVFETGATFREDIGPNNTQALYAMGSETEFCKRVAALHGAKAVHVDGPQVGHIVKAKHLTPEYIGQRAFRQGKGITARMYANASANEVPRPRVRGEIRLAMLRALSPFSPDAYWLLHQSKGSRAWLRSRLDSVASG